MLVDANGSGPSYPTNTSSTQTTAQTGSVSSDALARKLASIAEAAKTRPTPIDASAKAQIVARLADTFETRRASPAFLPVPPAPVPPMMTASTAPAPSPNTRTLGGPALPPNPAQLKFNQDLHAFKQQWQGKPEVALQAEKAKLASEIKAEIAKPTPDKEKIRLLRAEQNFVEEQIFSREGRRSDTFSSAGTNTLKRLEAKFEAELKAEQAKKNPNPAVIATLKAKISEIKQALDNRQPLPPGVVRIVG